MFKKLVSSVGGLMLALWLCGTALAAEPLIANQQQALEAAKKLLPAVVGNTQMEVEFREDDYRGKPVWSLRFVNDSPRPFGPFRDGHIEINAKDGSLLSLYYQPDPAGRNVDQQIVDRNQAKEIALGFIKKMQPGLISQIRLEDNQFYPNYLDPTLELVYSFRWNRVANGIPVQGDGIGVRVDAVTGKVVGYDFNWNDEAAFPTPAKEILGAESVANLVLDKLGLYPNYRLRSESGSNPKVELVYQINSNYYEFDAFTGKPVDYEGQIRDFDQSKTYRQAFSPVLSGETVPAEYRPGQQISPLETQKIAEEFFKKMGYSGKVFRSGSGGEGGPGYRIERWDYRIETGEKGKSSRGTELEVSIESSTGNIVGFHNWNHERSSKTGDKTIDYQKAQAIAERFVKENLSIKYPVVLRNEVYSSRGPDEPYGFAFARLVHGVPFDFRGLRVSVDPYSGKVTDYDLGILPVSVPPPGSIIDSQAAVKAIKNNQFLELCYKYARDKEQRPTNKVLLVYQLKDYGYGIDAVTGQSFSKEMGSNVMPKITNHWARGPLELLADSRLLPSESFNPDGKVSRREALRILTAATRYYYDPNEMKLNFSDIKADDPDLNVFKRAVQMGMLDNNGMLNPSTSLTREQLAVWLVNALGYEELANSRVKIEVPFKDLDKTPYQKHIALVAALGLFAGDKDGYFHPQQSVTWAELATVVTRVAPRISNRY